MKKLTSKACVRAIIEDLKKDKEYLQSWAGKGKNHHPLHPSKWKRETKCKATSPCWSDVSCDTQRIFVYDKPDNSGDQLRAYVYSEGNKIVELTVDFD